MATSESEDLLTCESNSQRSFFQTISGTLVSVELLTARDMRPLRSRVSRQRSTRRVILKASITSVILLSIAFIITYSVILTYVSNKVPLMRHQDGSSSDKSKSGKRTKLIARPMDVANKNTVLKFKTSNVVKWDIEEYDNANIEKPKCAKESKIVILITSAPKNVDRRNSIRDTWCKAANFNLVVVPWQCVFLIGYSQDFNVHEEIEQHHDILVGSYLDSYRNLTVKIMHGLNWVSHQCPTEYVLKTDDDVYVNTQLLSRLISNVTSKDNVYIGLVVHTLSRLKVIREPMSKWYVSHEQYPESHYPPYAIGLGYIMSIDVVHKVVIASQQIPPFANEDAYIGVLVNQVNIAPIRSGRFTLTSLGLRTCNLRYLVIVHHALGSDQQKLFEMTQNASRTCGDDTSVADSWT